MEAPINGLTRNWDSPLAEELLEQVPVAQFLFQAASVVEGVEADVVLVVPREDLRDQEAIGEVPVRCSETEATEHRLRGDAKHYNVPPTKLQRSDPS